jgi:predicted RNA polymerase sigma factor
MVEGPAAGLAAIEGFADHPALARYYLLPATCGEFHRRLDEPEAARCCFEDALRIATATLVREFLKRRLAALPDSAKR